MHRYEPLTTDGEGKAEQDVLGSRRTRNRGHGQSLLAWVLVGTNVFWLLVVAGLWMRSSRQPMQHAYKSDFASPHVLPRLEKQVRFDDILLWNESSNELYRKMDPAGTAYFGPPSPKIDANWEKLLRWQYPSVSEEEIGMNEGLGFAEGDRHPKTGKFHAALDVFHSLHCLNMVRMKLDDAYYHMDMKEKRDGDEGMGRDHIDHCMNHIRQALQCRPDLGAAAMSVYTDTDGSKYFLGNAETHSCLDWEAVVGWAEERERRGEVFAEVLE